MKTKDNDEQRVSFVERLTRFFFPSIRTADQPEQTYPENTVLDFRQYITALQGSGTECITHGAVDRILDAFIDAVDKEGLSCGGAVSHYESGQPECFRCDGVGILNNPQTPVAVRLIEDKQDQGFEITTIEAWVLLEWYMQLAEVDLDELCHFAESQSRPEICNEFFDKAMALYSRLLEGGS